MRERFRSRCEGIASRLSGGKRANRRKEHLAARLRRRHPAAKSPDARDARMDGSDGSGLGADDPSARPTSRLRDEYDRRRAESRTRAAAFPRLVRAGIRHLRDTRLRHLVDVSTIAISLTCIGVVSTLGFLGLARKRAAYHVVVVTIEPRNSELAAYVATYLLPFVTVVQGSWQEVASLGVFLFFIGLLYVRSGMLYLNPLLALFGYSVAPWGASTPVGTSSTDSALTQQQFMIFHETRTPHLATD